MNLNCIVQLHNRELPYSTKWQRSVLSIEKKVDSYKIEAYLVWETEEKNKIKYLISTKDLYNYSNNLIDTDLEYANSREMCDSTLKIWFKNPPYILVIKSSDDDSIFIFGYFVRCIFDGWWDAFYLMSRVTSTFTLENTKYIRNKSEYPPTEDFPRTTENLILQQLDITELDLQSILSLHSLRTLNLSNNQILFLPKELGTLPLEQLVLSYNCLGNTCLEIAKWEWMEQIAISQSLKELNIKNNNLTELPLQIGKLQSLIRLNVSNNLLQKIPQIIGTLQQLAFLDVSINLLSYLPGSMRGMELCVLCTENNPFKDFRIDECKSPTLKVVSLLNLAAKAVKKYRLPYNNLPSEFARYLDNSKYCCICRNPCFRSDIKDFKLLLDRPSYSISKKCYVCQPNGHISANGRVIFKCYFCSPKCYGYYCKTFN